MIDRCIWVVIVTYYPDAEILGNMCRTLCSSGANIVIVDNSEAPEDHLTPHLDKVEVIELGYNSGIARAQNIGTKYALGRDASIVVYLDQDSVLDSKFLGRLLEPIGDEDETSVRVPVVCDANSGSWYPSVSVSEWGFSSKLYAHNSNEPVETTVGISSGTAVPSLTFNTVGLFDERLFIDYVDTEWFLRCQFHSISVFVMPRAILSHRIGDGSIEKGYIKLHIHNSRRVYYQVRNSIALLWMPHVPFIFSIREVTVTLIHKMFQTFYIERKHKHLSSILKGIVHGVSNKSKLI